MSFRRQPPLDFGKFASTRLLNYASANWLTPIDAATVRVDSPLLNCKRMHHFRSCDNGRMFTTSSIRNAETTSYNILNNPPQSWVLWILTNFQHRLSKLLQNWVNEEESVHVAFLLAIKLSTWRRQCRCRLSPSCITFSVQLSSSTKKTLFVTLSTIIDFFLWHGWHCVSKFTELHIYSVLWVSVHGVSRECASKILAGNLGNPLKNHGAASIASEVLNGIWNGFWKLCCILGMSASWIHPPRRQGIKPSQSLDEGFTHEKIM